MELEYKWDLTEAGGPAALDAAELVSPFVTGAGTVKMHATYYDTTDGLARRLHAGLRLRRENDASVCCLKLPVEQEGGLSRRREFEVPADDVRAGLRELPGAGAPLDVCERFLAGELVALCETEFTRRAFSVAHDERAQGGAGFGGSFEAEIAVDAGVLRREGREEEFHEMEFEFKGGSEDAFRAMAERIRDAGHFSPQPLSKLARAMRV